MERLQQTIARHAWILTALSVGTALCFVAGSYLYFFPIYGDEASACWLVGSVLMLVDSGANAVLRHVRRPLIETDRRGA